MQDSYRPVYVEMFVLYCCLTVGPHIIYLNCIIDNKSHYQVLVSVVIFTVHPHIFHMHSYVSASIGNTAHIIFLILFSILSRSVLAVQNEKLLRGILVSRIQKCYTKLNLVTVAVL